MSLLEYRDSEARDGATADLDLNINKRLTTTAVGHLGFRYIDRLRLGKSSKERSRDAAFDTATQEVYLGIDFRVAPNVFLFAEYGYANGVITSTVSGGVDPDINYKADTKDPVFDDCAGEPGCNLRYAYRIVADIHKLDTGISFPVGAVNLDLTAAYFEADSGGTRYEDWMVKLGMLWNF